MSFSPVEVAKVRSVARFVLALVPLTREQAFEAPILYDANSNSSGRDIAKQLGSVHVRYGTIWDSHMLRGKLVLTDALSVQRPRDGDVYEA